MTHRSILELTCDTVTSRVHIAAKADLVSVSIAREVSRCVIPTLAEPSAVWTKEVRSTRDPESEGYGDGWLVNSIDCNGVSKLVTNGES